MNRGKALVAYSNNFIKIYSKIVLGRNQKNIFFENDLVSIIGNIIIFLFLVVIFYDFLKDSLFFDTTLFSGVAAKIAKMSGENVVKNSSKVLGTQLTKDNDNSSHTSSKSYATHNVRQPDPNSVDPQAAVNNPPVNKGGSTFQHPEFVRGTCDQSDCKGQDCGPLLPGTTTASCGETVKNLESVGHGTSGNPSVNTGNVVNIDPNTNFVGATKQQNAVIYNTPHSTGITPEAFPTPGNPTGKGTDFLHDPNHPHRVTTIIEETKNK